MYTVCIVCYYCYVLTRELEMYVTGQSWLLIQTEMRTKMKLLLYIIFNESNQMYYIRLHDMKFLASNRKVVIMLLYLYCRG